MTRTRTTVLAATLLLALAACGSDDGGGDDQAPSGATEAALRQAIQANMDALNNGDVQGLLDSRTQRCREATTEAEAQQAIDLTETLYGDLEMETLEIRDFDGTSAIVKGTTGIQALDEHDDGSDGDRWIYEDGAWRSDDC